MSGGLAERLERLQEQMQPGPGELQAIVLATLNLLYTEASDRERDTACDPGIQEYHAIGTHRIVFLTGGSPKERKAELRRLRQSGVYDVDPFKWTPPISGDDEERKAIGEGEHGRDCD